MTPDVSAIAASGSRILPVLLLAAGEHPKVVSERLGHASTNLTMDTYSHVLPDMQQRAAEKLERMLFSSCSRTLEKSGEQ